MLPQLLRFADQPRARLRIGTSWQILRYFGASSSATSHLAAPMPARRLFRPVFTMMFRAESDCIRRNVSTRRACAQAPAQLDRMLATILPCIDRDENTAWAH